MRPKTGVVEMRFRKEEKAKTQGTGELVMA